MNFDNLKDAWANDRTDDISLPVRKAALSETRSVVSTLRRNMKREIIFQLTGFAFLIPFVLLSPKNTLSMAIVSIALLLLLVQIMWYSFRFYLFYKAIGRYDLNLRKSIFKITYELELNIETYKTFNYIVTPLAALIIIGSLTTSLFVILFMAGMTHLISLFLFKLYVQIRYGRQLMELKKIMEDLESED
jgi:hypothetical protein